MRSTPRPSRHPLPLATTLLLLAAPPTLAVEFTIPWTEQQASFELTETLVFDYHDDNFDGDPLNDHYFDLRNRLNLKLAVGDFSFSARLDTATFLATPDIGPLAGAPPYLDRYGEEKLSATYRGRRFQATLGDFYASFGRGLALQLTKIDELSQDTSLRGARLRTELGPLELTLLGGLSNPTNADGVTEKTVADPYDLVSGLEVRWRALPELAVSTHGVWVWTDPLTLNEAASDRVAQSQLPEHAIVAGASLAMPDLWDWGDAYVEFDGLWKKFRLPDLPGRQGWALYAGGHLFLGDVTVTVEAKSYEAYELYTVTDGGDHLSLRLDYIQPPTLEPEEMEIHNNTDVSGGRLQLDWRPAGGSTLLFGSYAAFWATDREAPAGVDDNRWIYNANLGAEQDFLGRGRARLRAGIREEVPRWTGGEHRHLIYLDASLKLPLGERHGLDLHGSQWFVHSLRGRPGGAPPTVADTIKGELTLGYSFSPWLTLGVILGWDTDHSGSRDLQVFYTPEGGSPVRQIFLAGSASLDLFDVVVIQLLAGQLRGGPLCVNGSCRVFPPFSGVRLQAVVRL